MTDTSLPAIPLPGGPDAPILHEDRGLLVIDKPPGWRGAPSDPETTARNLQKTLEQAVESHAPWVASLRLKFLRVVHSPDAAASGPALVATDLDAARNFSRLLDRAATAPEEQYLAVVGGKPNQRHWICRLKIHPDPRQPGRMLTDTRHGLHAVTEFEVVSYGDGLVLLMATPRTRHPHQIRAHLAAAGLPIVGDTLYGFGREPRSPLRANRSGSRAAGDPADVAAGTAPLPAPRPGPIGLRSVRLAFPGFPGLPTFDVSAEVDSFLARYGFAPEGGQDPAVPPPPTPDIVVEPPACSSPAEERSLPEHPSA